MHTFFFFIIILAAACKEQLIELQTGDLNLLHIKLAKSVFEDTYLCAEKYTCKIQVNNILPLRFLHSHQQTISSNS